ncbi:hypothetical protein [Acinetobacter baumannii]|uniref:hypothetical protein n=1 Tax=Acinetobacter baumannii TaxID=470 RepID=UPI00338D3FE4
MDKSKIEYLEFYKAELGNGKHCTKSFGLAVWQHQQAKVDELTRKLSAALGELNVTNKNLRDRFSAFQMVRQEADDQQKRMNAALEIAEDLMQSMEMYSVGEKLEKILKVPQPITFQAGDKVVIDSLIVSDRVLTIDEILEDGIILAGAFLPIRYLTQLRHAKPEEEATGYRNPLEGIEK